MVKQIDDERQEKLLRTCIEIANTAKVDFFGLIEEKKRERKIFYIFSSIYIITALIFATMGAIRYDVTMLSLGASVLAIGIALTFYIFQSFDQIRITDIAIRDLYSSICLGYAKLQNIENDISEIKTLITKNREDPGLHY